MTVRTAILLSLTLSASCDCQDSEPYRAWTRKDGNTATAAFAFYSAPFVGLNLRNSRQPFRISFDDLSKQDQTYVIDWWLKNRYVGEKTDPLEVAVEENTKVIPQLFTSPFELVEEIQNEALIERGINNFRIIGKNGQVNGKLMVFFIYEYLGDPGGLHDRVPINTAKGKLRDWVLATIDERNGTVRKFEESSMKKSFIDFQLEELKKMGKPGSKFDFNLMDREQDGANLDDATVMAWREICKSAANGKILVFDQKVIAKLKENPLVQLPEELADFAANIKSTIDQVPTIANLAEPGKLRENFTALMDEIIANYNIQTEETITRQKELLRSTSDPAEKEKIRKSIDDAVGEPVVYPRFLGRLTFLRDDPEKSASFLSSISGGVRAN